MAVAEPQPNRAVFDPTRDPDAVARRDWVRRRYWISAVVGVVLLALAVAVVVYLL